MSHLRFRWLSLLILSLTTVWAIPSHLWAQTTNQAALVVRHGEGQVETRCVSFTEPQISGYDLLVRAGFSVDVDASGIGAAVCAINGTGCPANNCFCQCSGSDCQYWSYWHQLNGSWDYSLVGASIYPVAHGAVEGWSWGPGSVTQAIAPPLLSFEQICTAAVENTPTPTDTPPLPTPMPEPVVLFWLDSDRVSAGNCTTIHWDVQNVNALFFDDIGVQGQESRQLCPSQSQTYTLRAAYFGGEIIRQLTLELIPAITTPTLPPTATHSKPPTHPAPTATPSTQPSSTPQPPTPTHSPQLTHEQQLPSPDLPATATSQPATLVMLLIPTITPLPILPTMTYQLPTVSSQPTIGNQSQPLISRYFLFGLIVLGLGTAIFWQQRHLK